jgi:hypothetical protein
MILLVARHKRNVDAELRTHGSVIEAMPGVLLLATDTPPRQLYEILKPLLGAKDPIMIVEIDSSNRSGQLPRPIWEWIAQQPEPVPKTPAGFITSK